MGKGGMAVGKNGSEGGCFPPGEQRNRRFDTFPTQKLRVMDEAEGAFVMLEFRAVQVFFAGFGIANGRMPVVAPKQMCFLHAQWEQKEKQQRKACQGAICGGSKHLCRITYSFNASK